VIIGNVTPAWSKLAISVPAAAVRNVLGVDNGELRPSWKTALNALTPDTVQETGSSGTSLVFSHRDHVHAHSSGYLPDAHHTQSHNHSAAGDGTSLNPATLIIPVTTVSPTVEGDARWHGTANLLRIGDGAAAKLFIPLDDATSDPLDVGEVASDGTENTVARKDHVHGHGVSSLPNAHHAQAHAAQHAENAADELDAAALGSGASTDGQVLTSDGLGGAAWEAVVGGSGHTIRENGVDMTARTGLNFIDADAIVGTTLVADDAGGNETEVYMNLYALLTGRAGGQTLSGGSATNEILYLRGTSNVTPGTAHVEILDGLTVAAGNITMSGAGATVDGVDVGAHHVATTGVHGAGANTLLHSASAAGGDATGTLGALVITDDSHGHTSTTVTTHSTAHANDHTQSHDHSAAGDGQNLLPTTITLPNVGGLHILDTDSSHDLVIQPGSNLTVDRILTLTTGDAARTLTLGGDTTLNGGTHSGTNTGDQTITLTGDVTGSGTGSFAATVGDNTHAHDSTTVTTHSTAHANDHVRSHDLEGASDHTTSSGVDGHFMRQTGATTFAFEADYYTINFIINGGGSAITTGVKGWVEVPGPGVLEEWRILLSAAENITVDIDYDTYANFPTVGNDLVAPSTTGVQKNEATGLSAAIPDKSILEFNVTGAPATAQMCTVALRIRKT